MLRALSEYHESSGSAAAGHPQLIAKPTGAVSNRSRQQPFEDPVVLPSGRQLVTLKDAADFIIKLPKAEQNFPEGRARPRR